MINFFILYLVSLTELVQGHDVLRGIRHHDPDMLRSKIRRKTRRTSLFIIRKVTLSGLN